MRCVYICVLTLVFVLLLLLSDAVYGLELLSSLSSFCIRVTPFFHFSLSLSLSLSLTHTHSLSSSHPLTLSVTCRFLTFFSFSSFFALSIAHPIHHILFLFSPLFSLSVSVLPLLACSRKSRVALSFFLFFSHQTLLDLSLHPNQLQAAKEARENKGPQEEKKQASSIA